MVGKQYIEDYVLEKCKSLLTDKNIKTIAKKISAIAKKDNANHLLEHMQKQVQEKTRAKDNQLRALDTCNDDIIRQEIFARVRELKEEIDNLESSIAVEKTKTLAFNEEEIKYFLTQFRDYDILNIAHRKALVNMLINKIYLYDDNSGDTVTSNYRITIIFNAGRDTVEITDELYKDIKKQTGADKFCISNGLAHHG